MQVNESVDQLVAKAAKLALAIHEAATLGYLTDGGTLQELAVDVETAVRAVEDEYDLNDGHDVGYNTAADDQDIVQGHGADAPDAHLEAQVENDLGDVDGGF